MSVPIRSSDDILAALRTHPEWKEAVRRQVLTDDLLELPAKIEKAELERKEDQKKVWDAINKLAEAQRQMDVTLKAFMEATEKRLHGIESELDYFAGKSMELDAKKKLGNYLRDKVRKLRRCDEDMVDSLIDTALESGHLTDREGHDLGDADILVAGKDRESGKFACVAVEVSKTVDKHDVDRAARRARLFLKASRAVVALNLPEFLKIFPQPPEKAYGLVMGRRIAEEARREAEQKGVLFAKYSNGHDREGC